MAPQPHNATEGDVDHDDSSIRSLVGLMAGDMQAEEVVITEVGVWTHVHFAGEAERPTQGWKLHISASPVSAPTIARRVAALLLPKRVDHKYARNLEVLELLNEGLAGVTQIGKFITVYPSSDAEAVSLASQLDEALGGLHGPSVLFDRRLHAESLVHYRYGSFAPYLEIDGLEHRGVVLNAERLPVEDDRRNPVPAWIDDPFVIAGVAAEPTRRSLVDGRYLPLRLLQESGRGSVHMAIDLTHARPCILKRARRVSGPGASGTDDAATRLEREGRILLRMAGDPAIPLAFDYVETPGDSVLVMEDMQARSVQYHIDRLGVWGRRLPLPLALEWSRELVDIVGRLHRNGIVHNDIKPANVLLRSDGALALIDFESATMAADTTPGVRRGTPGFSAPQLGAAMVSDPADDVYALGATIWYLLTGAQPGSFRPDTLSDPDLTRGLRPDAPLAILAILAQCVKHDRGARFADANELGRALRDPPSVVANDGISTKSIASPNSSGAPSHALLLRISALLVDESEQMIETVDREGMRRALSLGHGLAGVVLVLSQLQRVSELEHLRAPAESAARQLRRFVEASTQSPVPGLLDGSAGLAWTLLEAGHAFEDEHFWTVGCDLSRLLSDAVPRTGDLAHGSAGLLRLQLRMWVETREAWALESALRLGDQLESTAALTASRACWPGADGSRHPGYLLGTSGIADALLDLWRATGDDRWQRLVRKASAWLASCSVADPAGNGAVWRTPARQNPTGSGWASGSAGIAGFLTRASHFGATPSGALAANAQQTTWSIPMPGNPFLRNGTTGLLWLAATTDMPATTLSGCLVAQLEKVLDSPNPDTWLSRPAAGLLDGWAGVAGGLLLAIQPHRLEPFASMPFGSSVDRDPADEPSPT